MLGSRAEADDLLQDAYLRWHQSYTEDIQSPIAFLVTMTTRLCLDRLRKLKEERARYVGPWLPEPIATADDPAIGAERAEAMSLAVLLLLERLTPAERAAFVLHEAFDYPYRQVAEVLEISEANARQLATRARAHLDRERARAVGADERSRLLAAFVAAAQNGDLEALEAVLAEDVVALSDGGGVVLAARKPVIGRERVARFLLGVIEKFTAGVEAVPALINGEPGFIGIRDGVAMAAWTVEIGPDGVQRFLNVMNPAKLSRLTVPSGHS
jgi:RNA polymerase sigma-70 factor (ECF subfamily)